MGFLDFLKPKQTHSKNLTQTVHEENFDLEKYKAEKAEFDIQCQINYKGMLYEKNGEIDKAIEQYESVISRNFVGSHPYNRLAILYRKRKQVDDEIRVLEKAIFVFQNIVYKYRGDRSPKLQKFEERLEKAKRLKKKQSS